MSGLSNDDIRKVASLARLTVSAEEVETLKSQLGEVLKYIDRLSEVDTSTIEPLVHAIELQNVFRPDTPQASLPRESALKNAPQTDGRSFLVPPILDSH